MKQIFRKRFLFGSILGLFFVGIFLWIFFREQNTYIAPLDKPVVTVINQIRGKGLGLEHTDLLVSLQGQYSATAKENIVATWLWQYSAMEDQQLVSFAKKQMKGQEFGIFLEIDRNTAAKSGVVYRGQGPWYFSDGLFLNAYDVGERKKLIDTLFAQFKNTFGYYPKTVGAWWAGAESLRYMHDRYGVIAFLQCSDQYEVDAYTIWGTPWSIPYISARNNAAAPASSFDSGSGVVTMQWSARDPTYGYGNSGKYSTYSMQDYGLKHYNFDYFDYLFRVFLHKPGDQLVIGLEGGFSPEAYHQDYLARLQRAKQLQKEQGFVFVTAGDFAQGFIARKDVFGGTRYFLSDAFDTSDQSFWFHSESYRAAILKQGDEIFLVDLRDYTQGMPEEFIFLPNSQGHLRVVPDVVIDSAHVPRQKLLLATTDKPLTVQDNGNAVLLKTGNTEVVSFTKDEMNLLTLKKPYTFKSDSFSFESLNLVVDQKQLFLFYLIPFIPFIFPWNFFIIFYLLPFLLLVFAYYFFIVRQKQNILFFLSFFFFVLLYAHMPAFLVTEFITRKTVLVAGAFGMFSFTALSILLFLVLKKRKQALKKAFFIISAAGIFLAGVLLLSWQQFVITPFEKDALAEISQIKKDVLFIEPKKAPVYRAVEPLLLNHWWTAEKITGVSWENIVRPEGIFLEIPHADRVLIFVPRYLGSELYLEEKEKYKLQKIFDNGQIELYQQ